MYPSGSRGSKSGGRGGQAGRGRGMAGGRGAGAKRKNAANDYFSQVVPKKARNDWQTQPIAQQPLSSYDSQWYQDSYNQQWR